MEAAAADHAAPRQASKAAAAQAPGLELGAHPLIDELRQNCDAMVRHALASGIPVPASVVALAERARIGDPDVDLRNLVRAHDRLLRLVAPATPRTIRLLDDEPTGWFAILGPVRLIRHMVVVVVVLLALFIGLASTQWINTTSGDILASHGFDALANELFFLAAGGIGAAFAALFRAYTYIADGTYDPKYESSYWIRVILGLMAGVLLPALVPIGEGTSPVTRPVLALVGGFSAALVYTILQRLVDVVGSVFEGAGDAPRPVVTDPLALTGPSERIALVAELTKLGERLRAAGTAEAAAEVDVLLRTLLPDQLGADIDLGDLEPAAESPPPATPVSTTS
jgi:hypothetical protein